MKQETIDKIMDAWEKCERHESIWPFERFKLWMEVGLSYDEIDAVVRRMVTGKSVFPLIDLDELEKLEAGAYLPPWKSIRPSGPCGGGSPMHYIECQHPNYQVVASSNAKKIVGYQILTGRPMDGSGNTDFVAALRNAFPDLLALARIGQAAVEVDQQGYPTHAKLQKLIDDFIAKGAR